MFTYLVVFQDILEQNKPSPNTPSLFALTGLSNITNAKSPGLYSSSSEGDDSIIAYAQSLGYHVLLDAAALAATTRISLAEIPACYIILQDVRVPYRCWCTYRELFSARPPLLLKACPEIGTERISSNVDKRKTMVRRRHSGRCTSPRKNSNNEGPRRRIRKL